MTQFKTAFRVQTWHLRQAETDIPGRDGFIPGSDHANLCLAWNKSVFA